MESLEGPHPPAKWTIEEIREIKREYADKYRNLERCQREISNPVPV